MSANWLSGGETRRVSRTWSRTRLRVGGAALLGIVGFVVPSTGVAAPLVTCPAGASDVSLRSYIFDEALDDGSWQVPANDVAKVFPNGIPFIQTATRFWININGNISFGNSVSTYTPNAIPGLSTPSIAPYFGDVDLRSGQGDVRFCVDQAGKRLIVTWKNVGYYNQKTNKLSSFQTILERNDDSVCLGTPSFDVEFRYEKLQWTTGDMSGGSDGLGGTRATAGIDGGNTVDAVALPGSRTADVINLVNKSNVDEPGVFRFLVAQGKLPSCGNGTVQVCEECDDGNGNNNDACTNLCRLNVCGDGFLHDGVEDCDGDEFAAGKGFCPSGFTGSPVCNADCTVSNPPVGCVDIDECADPALNDCHANATCTNLPGGYECTCKPGYGGDGVSCTDVDECATGQHSCDANATCANTTGSYTCSCKDGFVGNGFGCTDVDECANPSLNDCDANASCTNVPGSYECACKDGFTGDGVSCTDVDECATGQHSCDANATCANTTGGYTCTCKDGYAGNGFSCDDVDECATGQHGCGPNASCTNTTGGYVCGCNAGYVGDGVVCVDVDECKDPLLNDCDENAACANTDGGFVCACKDGYEGDGKSCTDVDECADPALNDCGENASCTNTDGGFTCGCNEGYEGDGKSCVDVDECVDPALNDCGENATCTNTDGGFTCGCNEGYEGDGKSCVDIDECADPELNDCGEDSTCINTEGGFTCGPSDGGDGGVDDGGVDDGGATDGGSDGGAVDGGSSDDVEPGDSEVFAQGSGCACSVPGTSERNDGAAQALLGISALALIGARRRRGSK